MSDNLAPVGTVLVPPEGEPSPAEPQAPPGAKPVEAGAPQTAPTADASTQKAGMNSDLVEEYSYQRPRRGEIRQGRVITKKEDGIVVDLGL